MIESFLKPRLGELPIDAIDANRMRELDAELVRRGVEPATRRQMQAVLRSILCRFAVESGRLTEAPRFPRLPKAGLKIVSTFTEEDVRSVLRVAHAHLTTTERYAHVARTDLKAAIARLAG